MSARPAASLRTRPKEAEASTQTVEPSGRSGSRRWWLLAAVTVAIVHVVTRVLPLQMSLTHDEAHSVMQYIAGGPVHIYFEPYIVNNHVLFSLLAWATTQVLGTAEAVYRLWSVLPAIAAVAWASVWLGRRHGPWAGIALAVLATLAPLFATYTVQARGYGIALLASVAMLVLTVRYLEHGDRRSLVALGAAGVVGFWAYPLMATVFAGHAAALFALRPQSRRAVTVAVAATAMVSLAVMGPVVPELVRDALGLTEVPTQVAGAGDGGGGEESGTNPATGFLRQLVPGVERATSGLVAAAALAVYALLGVVGLAELSWRLRAVVAVPVMAFVGFHVATGLFFAPRFAVPVLLHVLVPVALGADVLRRRGSTALKSAATRGVAWLLVLSGVGVLLASAFVSALGLVTAPLQNSRGAADLLSDTDVDGPVYTNHGEPLALRYYAEQTVVFRDEDSLLRIACSTDPPTAVVIYGTPEAEAEACLLDAATHVQTFPQQWKGPPTVYLMTENEAGPSP